MSTEEIKNLLLRESNGDLEARVELEKIRAANRVKIIESRLLAAKAEGEKR